MGKRYEGFKEGFREGFREGLRAKSENELRDELKKELEEEVRQELRDELIDEVKEELREEIREECKEGYLKEYLEDFEEGFIRGFENEYPKGLRKGRLEVLSQVVQDGVISISEAAKFAGTTEDELRKELGLPPEAPNDAASEDEPDENAPATDSSTGTSASCEETSEDVSDEEKTPDEDTEERAEDERERASKLSVGIGARSQMIGVEEGSVKMLRRLVIDGVLTIAESAELARMTVPEFEIKAVRTDEQWRMEYEALLNLIGTKDEILLWRPEFLNQLEKEIADSREWGIGEGTERVLDPLIDKGVLTDADARRYLDEFC